MLLILIFDILYISFFNFCVTPAPQIKEGVRLPSEIQVLSFMEYFSNMLKLL
jgi:hypothetical protein